MFVGKESQRKNSILEQKHNPVLTMPLQILKVTNLIDLQCSCYHT